jgi:SAM-dependent methyltransferase
VSFFVSCYDAWAMLDDYTKFAAEWADRIRNKKKPRHEFLEKPAMFSKLPDLEGKSVLCIGCGSGEEAQYLTERGAAKVVGIDLSVGLIEQAKYAYPEVEFLVMDMERLDFPKDSFDFVYSSLTMHYAENWENIFNRVHKCLKSNGTFLFSTHHPVRWGAETKKENGNVSYLLGYSKRNDDSFEIYGDYLNTRKITDTWFDQMKVTYYHKPLSEIFKEIHNASFELTDFIEPKPLPQMKGERKDIYEIHSKIPLFMILELKKR